MKENKVQEKTKKLHEKYKKALKRHRFVFIPSGQFIGSTFLLWLSDPRRKHKYHLSNYKIGNVLHTFVFKIPKEARCECPKNDASDVTK